MAVFIRKMTEDEFESFHRLSIDDQAKDLMEETGLSQQQAVKEAEKEFSDILPDGLNTANNHLMSIVEMKTGDPVGFIWTLYEMTEGRKQSFLCDFAILESKRRKGYGAEALRLVETQAAEAGCRESVLFVSDRNDAAKALYTKCGYKILRQEGYGKYMVKNLP
ncbi:MAG: GNAT family N-acetyltransferase [Oscillospiraceae bacterium]|nr:GNAT family N-acetyltransferase [Oscillospiraceae bacterium]